MKKIIAIVLVLALVLSFTACADDVTTPTATETPTVTAAPATTSPTAEPTDAPEVEETQAPVATSSVWVSLNPNAGSNSNSNSGSTDDSTDKVIEWDGVSDLPVSGTYTYEASEAATIADADFAGTLTVTGDVTELTIEMPMATVEITGTITTLNGTTGMYSLHVKSGAKVTTLNVLGGNVLVESNAEVESVAVKDSANTTSIAIAGTAKVTSAKTGVRVETTSTKAVVEIAEESAAVVLVPTEVPAEIKGSTANFTVEIPEATEDTDTLVSALEEALNKGNDATDSSLTGSTSTVDTVSTYAELLSALSTSTTINFSDNIEIEETLAITSGELITINLNGYTLSSSCQMVNISNGSLIFNNGKIETTYGGTAMVLTVADTSAAAISRTLTMQDVEMTTTGQAAIFPAGEGALVNIIDSTISAAYYAIGTNATADGNGELKYGDIIINIDNSTVIATGMTADGCNDGVPIFLNVPLSLTIRNSVAQTNYIGIVNRGGDMTVQNVTIQYVNPISSTFNGGDAYDSKTWGSGTNLPIAAIVAGNRHASSYQYATNLILDNVTVDFGADVEFENIRTLYTYGNSGDGIGATITIASDMNLSTDSYIGPYSTLVIAEGKTLTIADGATLTNEGAITNSGTIQVYDEAGLKLAVAVGGCIKLGGDIVTTETIEITKDTTIDLNGHTIDAKKGDYSVITVTLGTFTLNDSVGSGEITGAYKDAQTTGGSQTGAGVWVSAEAAFVMNGGTITGNYAGNEGGGVYSNGSFTMTGGSITGNYAVNNGGGLTISRLSTLFAISGDAYIYNNYNCVLDADGYVQLNVYLGGTKSVNSQITIGALNDGAKIGVTSRYPGEIASVIDESYVGKIVSDSAAYTLAVEGTAMSTVAVIVDDSTDQTIS